MIKLKFLVLFFLIQFSNPSYSQTVIHNKESQSPDSTVFDKVEQEAEFPGGPEAWLRYLQSNLNADVPIKKRAKNGTYTVIVRFIVNKDGTISNIKAETNYGHGMEKEVIRVIKEGPNWMPAIQDGRKVRAYRRQPVTFVVSD